MRIVQAIRALIREARANRVMPGKGIAVARTPTGTIITRLEDAPGGGAGGGGHSGMFQIVAAEEGNRLQVINGNDPESESCGVAQVNGQSFAVAVFGSEELAAEQEYFVYLRFTPPREPSDDQDAVPAGCEVKLFTALQDSTPEHAYYLIGRAETAAAAVGLIDQAHWPGAILMHWYGPCLNILDEAEHG